MPQKHIWEKEYQTPSLVSLEDKPQSSVLRFYKFLKKQGEKINDLKVLDLGCGTGRNTNYLAQKGAVVWGIDISRKALGLAKDRAKDLGVSVTYLHGSIGDRYDFENNVFDLVLDVTSSNSLTQNEREIYLKETNRVLKPGKYFFVRALCKDGDQNAKTLLKNHPGKEYDTYIMPELGLTERVFSREDFLDTYTKYFSVLRLTKETHYSRFKNQKYKRNYWIAYFKKN